MVPYEIQVKTIKKQRFSTLHDSIKPHDIKFVTHVVTKIWSQVVRETNAISASGPTRIIKKGCTLMTPIYYLLTKICCETDLVFVEFEIGSAKRTAALL